MGGFPVEEKTENLYALVCGNDVESRRLIDHGMGYAPAVPALQECRHAFVGDVLFIRVKEQHKILWWTRCRGVEHRGDRALYISAS